MSVNSFVLFQDISHSASAVAQDDFDYAFNPGSQFEPIFSYTDLSNSNGDTIFSYGTHVIEF